MSRMEDDAANFLKKVVKTLGAGLLWMFINVTMGIYNGWLFFYDRPTFGNYIFYGWMLGSLVLLVWYYYKLWKDSFRNQ